MKKLKSALVLVALSVAIQTYAQGTKKVEGVVTDQNGAPISGAEVTFAGKAATVTRATDAEGRFNFDAQDDTAMMTIRARGFETASQVWNLADSARLRITLTAERLSEQMTVTASRTEARVSDTAASVAVLSAEDLSTTAALTLSDIVDPSLRATTADRDDRRADCRDRGGKDQCGIAAR